MCQRPSTDWLGVELFHFDLVPVQHTGSAVLPQAAADEADLYDACHGASTPDDLASRRSWSPSRQPLPVELPSVPNRQPGLA
jgi:hypothetical protein